MIPRPIRRALPIAALLFVIVIPFVWLRGGADVGKAFTLGFATGELSAFSFALLSILLSVGRVPTPRRAVVMSTVILFVKLPLIAFFCYQASVLGSVPRVYFVLGAALVYSALIALACIDLNSPA